VSAIYQYPEFAEAGGLMSYGGSLTASYQTAGGYAGRCNQTFWLTYNRDHDHAGDRYWITSSAVANSCGRG
jgi:hypothetical protein